MVLTEDEVEIENSGHTSSPLACVSMRLLRVVGLVLGFVSALTSSATAATITYTYTGVGSGTIGALSFTNQPFVIHATGDTTNRVGSSSTFFSIINITADISIGVLGDFTFLTPTEFFNNPSSQLGFANASGLTLYGFQVNVAELQAWDMLSSIGPISGTAFLGQWTISPINTSGGVLVFNPGGNAATFQATVGNIVTAAQSFVYVTNLKSNTVSVFDSSTNNLVATIPVGTNPVGITLTPDGAFAYVANQTYPGSVSVINTQSNTVTSTIPVGPFPTGMAITPNGRFVYAVDSTSPGAVSVIDTTVNSVVATIPEGVFPNWVAISPDGMFAYVTNAFSTPAYISVISTATNTEVATIPVGQQPTGIAITPNGAFAYVADGYGSADSVYVIDLRTNTVVSTIPVGINPGRVSITRDGAFAYVSNFNSGSVSVIDTRTNTVATTVPVGIEPLDIAFTSDGLLAYVANSDFFGGQGNISVIGTLSRTVVATLASGNVPDGAAATPPPSASTGCVFSLSPRTQVIGPQGGLGSFMINAAAGCQWHLAVNASWIAILNGALGGSGSRKVLYAVNSDGGVARSGIVTVGSLVFSVDQQGFAPTCSFSISPSHGTFASTGGNVGVVVTAPPGTACAWKATSNAPWLTVVSGASGSGSGTVTLHASPNPGALRTGTAIIAGQVFSATQPAAGVMACGALDVTSQVAVNESGLTWIWLSNFQYSQTITVRNLSSSVIHGPVYLVTVGEPTNYGFGSNSGLQGGGAVTHCFSSTGDYLILLLPPGDLLPGQAVGTDLVWFEQSQYLMPTYRTRVLSGTPTK